VTQSSDPLPHVLWKSDGQAIIGVLAILAGQVLGESCDPGLLARVGQCLEQTGAIRDPDSRDQVFDALEDVIAQVRYVLHEEGERPERNRERPPDYLSAPPKGVSGYSVAKEVPLGRGPTASCVLSSVIVYATGFQLELDLAWTPTAEQRAQFQPPRAHGRFSHNTFEPIQDWWVRVDLPDGRSAATVLEPDSIEDWTDESREWDLRIYPQSVQTSGRFDGAVTVRWRCWVPVTGVASIRVTTSWVTGAIPKSSADIDLGDD
jgi:hypothetical protein